MLFWFLGLTVLVVFLTLGRRRIDYRLVLLGALIPDLIDRPLGLLSPDATTRSVSHSLVFVLALMFAIMFFLRGSAARRWFVFPIAILIHLAIDGMWNYPQTFFWPFFGPEFSLIHEGAKPWLLASKELIGIAILVYLGYAYDLHTGESRREFLAQGTLSNRRPARGGSNGR